MRLIVLRRHAPVRREAYDPEHGTSLALGDPDRADRRVVAFTFRPYKVYLFLISKAAVFLGAELLPQQAATCVDCTDQPRTTCQWRLRLCRSRRSAGSASDRECPWFTARSARNGHVQLFPFVPGLHPAGDGPRLVRAGSCLTLGF